MNLCMWYKYQMSGRCTRYAYGNVGLPDVVVDLHNVLLVIPAPPRLLRSGVIQLVVSLELYSGPV